VERPDEEEGSLSDRLDAYERELIRDALREAAGNVAEAARRLRTDRANLYRRMRRLGLDR
jgi:transcriptional regulator with GAF, ATPase, and Fis domain